MPSSLLQRIIGAISCDHVAGSEVKASLKPSTSPSSFPLPCESFSSLSDISDTHTDHARSRFVAVGEQIKAEEEVRQARLPSSTRTPDLFSFSY